MQGRSGVVVERGGGDFLIIIRLVCRFSQNGGPHSIFRLGQFLIGNASVKPIQRECERERTIIARINMCIEKRLLMSMPVEISLKHLINSSITEDQIKNIFLEH